MKKSRWLLLFLALLLTGCEKKPQETAPASLFELTDDGTSAGVRIGDDKDAFIKAYSQYTIQAAYTDTNSSYLVMSIRDIPYEDRISTLIANFFIDEVPMTEEEICENNQVTLVNLPELLSSYAYLRAHDVVYRFLRFTWEDGVITDIQSDELNYNETYDTPRAE